jgi:MFS family permease
MIGYLADRNGKKNILLIGQLLSIVFMIAFGASKNFYFAIIFRFLLGVFNGNVSTAKAYVGEITDGTNQATFVQFINWEEHGLF